MSVTAKRPIFLTLQETATLFRVEPRTIRKWVAAGRLPAKRISGSRGMLIAYEEALNLLQDVPVDTPSLVGQHTQAVPESGIIRRTQTPEGRARALAALDAMLEGDEDEHRRAWNYLQQSQAINSVQFRHWDPETGEQTEESTNLP